MTIGELYNMLKGFMDICIYPYNNSNDPNHYYRRFADILVGGKHIKWIIISDWIRDNRGTIADIIIRDVEESKSGERLLSKIVEFLLEINDLIYSHETGTDARRDWFNTKDATAYEMRDRIEDILDYITDIYPNASDFIKSYEKKKQTAGSDSTLFHKAFTTEKWKRLLDGLKENGLAKCNDNGNSEWISTASLYGYFTDRSSLYLSLREIDERIPWRYYGAIFTNHCNLLGSAKQAIVYYNNGNSKPIGYQSIISLTEDIPPS